MSRIATVTRTRNRGFRASHLVTGRHLATLLANGLAALLIFTACGEQLPTASSADVISALDNKSAKKKAAAGAGSAKGDERTAEDRAKLVNTRGPTADRGPDTPPMALNHPPADAVETASGMFYKVLAPAPDGRKPVANDVAFLHYTGWKTSGEVIYSTYHRGNPHAMALFQAPPGWREAVLGMRQGERRIYWMPGHLASAVPSMATAMTLVYEVQLVGVEAAPQPPTHLAAAPPDANSLPSGLAYKSLQPGKDDKRPSNWDQVTVHYVVWNKDGSLFQNTRALSKPRVTHLREEASGFAEAVRLLSRGQSVRVWMPEDLRKPLQAGDPGGLQVMDIELVDFVVKPAPPPVPKDVAGPPETAKKTEAGVFYEVLDPGKGSQNPTAGSTVTVHYTGWTTDGEMFDSSVPRGKPSTFSLNSVIPGWTDIVQKMVVGQRIRTWIPEKLAYQGKPDRPAGMLVFEIELVEIVD